MVIGIIGILSTMVMVSLGSSRFKARDTKRIADLSQIGRFLSFGCITPEAGAGEYDLKELIQEYKSKYPQYANAIPSNIKDPKSGTSDNSQYTYIVNEDNHCTLYANLENVDEKVTLESITKPTPGGGTGVFESILGINGSSKYYQISN